MFKNFDWHHWALLAIAVLVAAGPDVATALGNDGLTGAAGSVTRAVGFATFLLGLLKSSPMASQQKPVVAGVIARGLVILLMLGALVRFVSACAMTPAAAIATAVPLIEAGADLTCQTVAAVDQNEPGWFKFLCSYIDPATGKSSAGAAGTTTAFVVKVPAAHAYAFMKAHVPAAGL